MLSSNSRTTDSRDAAKSAELPLLCEPRPAACALMGKSRVVIGAVSLQQQLEMILRLNAHPDIEIIGPIADALELLMTVGEMNADAVILPLEEDGCDPGLCSHLIAEYPGVLLLAVSATGKRVFEFELCLAKRELADGDEAALNAIRLATAPR